MAMIESQLPTGSALMPNRQGFMLSYHESFSYTSICSCLTNRFFDGNEGENGG